jgi:hypothetical protein
LKPPTDNDVVAFSVSTVSPPVTFKPLLIFTIPENVVVIANDEAAPILDK